METFTFCPRVNPTGSTTFRTRTAGFGDGYTQRVGDGINTRKESWPLEFVGDEAEIAEIKAFLDARGGDDPFLWTPPLGVESEFVAPEGYRITAQHADLFTLSVTFTQNNPVAP